jgi:hypothetical protein
LNKKLAFEALENAKTSAKSAKEAAENARKYISRFYEIISKYSSTDVFFCDNNGATLFGKLALFKTLNDDKQVVITLSNPIEDTPKKPKWFVDLDRNECKALAYALLQEAR